MLSDMHAKALTLLQQSQLRAFVENDAQAEVPI